MTTRTNTKTVTFRRPFVLGGFDEVLPAGAYNVETDEELLEAISFPVYRRILTVIHLHAKSGDPRHTRALTIDPNELDAALARDQAPADIAPSRGPDQRIRKATPEPRWDSADCRALERGDDEGMIVRLG